MVTMHGCYGYYVLLPWLLVVPTLQPCDDGEMVFIIMTDVRETYDGSKLEMTTFYPQNRLSPYTSSIDDHNFSFKIIGLKLLFQKVIIMMREVGTCTRV